VSDFERAVFDFWYGKLIESMRDHGDCVSAGRVGRFAGKSRNTAKKYLENMVDLGVLTRVYSVAKNGVDQIEYAIVAQ